MRIYIKRGEQEYGPYPLEAIPGMIQAGNIVAHDMARAEDSQLVQTVGQFLGQPAGAAPPAVPQPPGYAVPAAYTAPAAATAGPKPPNLHWGLVLLFGMLTCGIFMYVWAFIQANFVKKIDPRSNAIALFIGAIFLSFLSIGMSFSGSEMLSGLATLVSLCSSGLWIYGYFTIRTSLLGYYNSAENISLRLSPIMTFFFGLLYTQYHFSRIADWKDGKPLVPQTYQG